MRKPQQSFLRLIAATLLTLLYSSCSPQAKKAAHLQKADSYFTAGNYSEAEIEYLNVLQLESLNPQAISHLGLIYFDQGRIGRVMPYLLKGRELQPGNLDIHIKLGLTFLSTGDRANARDEAEFILTRDPQNPGAALLLADAALKPEEFVAAQQRLSNLPAPAPQSAAVLTALGGLELRQRHFAEAEALIHRAQKQDPNSATAEAALGTWFRTQNNLAQAEQAFARASALAPIRSPLQLSLAKFKIQSGDLPGARLALQKITDRTPDYLPAILMLAEIAAAEKKFQESLDLIIKILTLDPTHPEALLLSARVRIAQGQNQKAAEELEKMTKTYPKSPLLYYQLGVAYANGGEFNKATGSLNQALALAPNLVEAKIQLAEIGLRKGDFRGAVSQLKDVVEQRPDLTQAQFMLADAYRGQGNLGSALEVYGQLENKFPGDPQASHWKGSVLLQQNERDAARKAFTKALEIAPGFLPSIEQLVDLDLKEKHVTEAQQRVDQLIARNPKLAAPYLLQAKIYLLTGENEKGEAALRKTIELQPESPTPYLLLARLYVATNQQDKALANFQTVLARNPKNVEALMLTASIYTQQKNYPAARDNYEKLLLVNPRFSPALNNLAYLYSEQFKQLDKAEQLAQKAKELLPDEPHTADTLGWILYQNKQYPWALNLLQSSAAKLPEDPEIQFHLGMIQYMLGNEDAAYVTLRQAVQGGQEFPGRDEANRCLSILAVAPPTAKPDDLIRLEKSVTTHPDETIALARLGAIYARDGSWEKAVVFYQKAVRASQNNIQATLALVHLLSANGKVSQAIELAKNARKIAPDDLDVNRTLGPLLYQSGDYTWALSLLRETARKLPDDPEVQFDLAEAAYSKGRLADAEDAMRRALRGGKIFSRSDQAHRFLEMTALAADPAAAAAARPRIDEVLNVDANYVPALMALAAERRSKSDDAAARQVYEKVLGLFPDFSAAKRELAVDYSNRPSDDRKAYDLAAKAREAFPDDAELAGAFGIISYRLGEYSRAASLLRESTVRRSDDGNLQYYLGASLYKLGRRDESRETLQRALKLKIKPEFATEATRLLVELK